MFLGVLALLSANIRAIFLVASGAVSVWALLAVYDSLIDDPRVAGAARKEYVAISELEAEKAKLRIAETLLAAERKRAAEIEADKAAFAEALSAANAQIAIAHQDREGLQNEIDELIAITPDGVPLVRDLGVKLRN